MISKNIQYNNLNHHITSSSSSSSSSSFPITPPTIFRTTHHITEHAHQHNGLDAHPRGHQRQNQHYRAETILPSNFSPQHHSQPIGFPTSSWRRSSRQPLHQELFPTNSLTPWARTSMNGPQRAQCPSSQNIEQCRYENAHRELRDNILITDQTNLTPQNWNQKAPRE